MTLKKNLILLLVLLVLGSFYYFYDVRGGKLREEAEAEDARVFKGITQETLNQITLQRIPELPESIPSAQIQNLIHRISMIKIEGQWQLSEPVIDRTNVQAMEKLQMDILKLQKGETISDTIGSQEQFGLISPAFIITAQSDSQTMSLQLGNKNPIGDAYYTTINSEAPVYLMDTSIDTHLFNTVLDYRDRNILPVAMDSIHQLEITSGDQKIILKRDSTEWLITSPELVKADTNRIESIITKVSDLQINKFIDVSDDAIETGFSSPYKTITFYDHQNSMYQLLIGTEADPGGKTYFAKTLPDKRIFYLPKELVNQFVDDQFSYQSKKVCDLEHEIVGAFVIESNGSKLEFVKDQTDNWIMSQPPGVEVDPQSVSGFLASLTYLRATGVADKDVDPGDSNSTIRLFGDDDKTLYELSLLGIPDDGVGHWVKVSNSEIVFRISDSDSQLFIPDPERFRSTQLLSFNRDTLKSIKIEVPENSIVFGPAGDSFKVTQGNSGVDSELLDKAYWTLHKLTFESIVEDVTTATKTQSYKRYGLEIPMLKVIVNIENTGSTELHFGQSTKADNVVFVTQPGSDRIWSVNRALIEPVLSIFS